MEEACKRLWNAVLNQAIKDVVDPRTRYKDRKESLEWFQSERQGVGSFLWVCNITGFNPSRVRTQLAIDQVKIPYSHGLFSPKQHLL